MTAEKHTADTLFTQWKKAHGTTRDDHAFTTWAEAHIPAPPSNSARAAELKQVQTLAHTRTPAGSPREAPPRGSAAIWRADSYAAVTTAAGWRSRASMAPRPLPPASGT
ncbi:hypothetical protein ACFZDP_32240 [Streptomyces mirabilis]|uniref:hypothetical protein n=1 Tax=Streptomyces mirabilis TaxID=68239 RepID=UPI0036E8B37C